MTVALPPKDTPFADPFTGRVTLEWSVALRRMEAAANALGARIAKPASAAITTGGRLALEWSAFFRRLATAVPAARMPQAAAPVVDRNWRLTLEWLAFIAAIAGAL